MKQIRLTEALQGMLDLWYKIGGDPDNYYVTLAESALNEVPVE